MPEIRANICFAGSDQMKPSEKAVLDYLKRFDGVVPPSVREICKATGIRSTSTVHRALDSLCESGHIEREHGSARAIRLHRAVASVPLFGGIADFVSDKPSEMLETNAKGSLFALKMRSSKEFQDLNTGDVLIFERCSTAKESNIVIVNTGRQTLLRRFGGSEDGYFTLTNDSQSLPLVVPEIKILAVAVGVYRSLQTL